MKKFNYRLTVNISQNLMQLGFRCQLPDEMQNKKIRLQAVFAPVSYTHLTLPTIA